MAGKTEKSKSGPGAIGKLYLIAYNLILVIGYDNYSICFFFSSIC